MSFSETKKDFVINVIKLGGTSQSKKGYDTLISNLKDNKTVVVVSALKNITNNLLFIIEKYNTLSSNERENWVSNNIITPNIELASSLGISDISFLKVDFNYLLLLMKNTSDKLQLQEKINLISVGETLTSKILNVYLQINNKNSLYLDSIQFIRCNLENKSIYNKGEFSVDKNVLLNNFKDNQIIVVPGFRGMNINNDLSLMGRGGSDTTGSIIAAEMLSDKYEIWTDVNGIYTGDPNNLNNVNIIKSISYDAAQEISAMGARVIHPYCIRPCKEKNIPIEIINTYDYNSDSTVIEENINKSDKTIYSITKQDSITVFKIESLNMWNNYGFVYDIFSKFKDFNVDVNIINTSQFDITTTTDDSDFSKLEKLKESLEKNYNVKITSDCCCVSIVGENIKKYNKLNNIMNSIINFDIKLTSYSSNDMTLSFVVEKNIANELVIKLHDIIFPFNKFNIPKNIWWNDLIKLEGPDKCKYLYNLEIVNEQISKLKTLTSVDRIYYAMKANYNEDIIKKVLSLGLGIETVSIEEINLVNDIISNIESIEHQNINILFTPNFSNIYDYESVLKYKMNIISIVDNIDVIVKYPSLFKDREIGLRLDLDYGFGHCNKVITQGQDSKFGIMPSDIIDNIDLFEKNNIKIIGLHSHMGSGITDYKHWVNNLKLIVDVYNKIPDSINHVTWFDIGGGFGIDNTINFEDLNNEIIKIKSTLSKNIKIFIEPGRFIVADSGIIWGKVTQIKFKNNTKFIGTNIGMTDLLRPALYSAIHPIYFKENDSSKEIVTVVGPICESGDVLIKNLEVGRDININDSIIVGKTGAYGIVMASKYNNRKLPEQLLI